MGNKGDKNGKKGMGNKGDNKSGKKGGMMGNKGDNKSGKKGGMMGNKGDNNGDNSNNMNNDGDWDCNDMCVEDLMGRIFKARNKMNR